MEESQTIVPLPSTLIPEPNISHSPTSDPEVGNTGCSSSESDLSGTKSDPPALSWQISYIETL